MLNPFVEFEQLFGLSAKQAATFLGIAVPTYYQYRRNATGPSSVIRCIEIFSSLPDEVIWSLIRKYVHPRKVEAEDEL